MERHSHPKATTAPAANNGEPRPKRLQIIPASGKRIGITSVGRCAARIITNWIKVRMTVNAP
ncbi:hypothetical protein UNPA324_08895 [Bradyrhizobium sp. UNPA324]|nr:hypothetical protein UNPA324_08895 [Bradyrhizobium sp. UNPA324]